MAHTFNPHEHQKLDAPERKKMLPPEEIFKLTGLTSGMTMADIGSGSGFFTIPAAAIVGSSGKVFASDISEEMLNVIRSKLTEENRDIISLIHTEKDKTGMSDNSANYLLLCTVLHETEDPQGMIDDIYRSIKKDGRCVIVEWIKRQTENGPPAEDRIAMNDVSLMCKNAGFIQINKILFNDSFYIVVTHK